jgi:hypothetical protein
VRRSGVRLLSTGGKQPILLVYGGAGALGSKVLSKYESSWRKIDPKRSLRCRRFKGSGWQTVSVDYVSNKDADINSPLDTSKNWQDNVKLVLERVKALGQVCCPVSDVAQQSVQA